MAVSLPSSVLPGIPPSRGEIDKRQTFRFISTVGDLNCETKSVPQVISPLEEEMSGRTEGGKRHIPRQGKQHSLRGQTHAR